jgi:hypothetical protein
MSWEVAPDPGVQVRVAVVGTAVAALAGLGLAGAAGRAKVTNVQFADGVDPTALVAFTRQQKVAPGVIAPSF